MEFTETTYRPCELYGCIYNEDGNCGYDSSAIKIPSACACYDNEYDEWDQ